MLRFLESVFMVLARVLAFSGNTVRHVAFRAVSAVGFRVGPTTPYGNPLPAHVHITLRRRDLKPGRVIIVGDVHGCHEELMDLLEAVKFDKATDNLILAGDLVNKGPLSVEVLRTVRQLGAFAVRGNHDDNVLAQWRDWKLKRKLLSSKKLWAASMTAEDAEVLEQLPFSLYLEPYHALVVHAGVVPMYGPGCVSDKDMQQPEAAMFDHSPGGTGEAGPQGGTAGGHIAWDRFVKELLRHQDLGDMVWMRNLYIAGEEGVAEQGGKGAAVPGRTRGSHHQYLHRGSLFLAPKGGVAPGASAKPCMTHWSATNTTDVGDAWAQMWQGPAHVFFGHDAKRMLQLEQCATGLDSACVYGKLLSAAVLPPVSKLEMSWGVESASPAGDGSGGGDSGNEAQRQERAGEKEGQDQEGGSPHQAGGGGAGAMAVRCVTREAMGCEIVSVPARDTYAEPKDKK